MIISMTYQKLMMTLLLAVVFALVLVILLQPIPTRAAFTVQPVATTTYSEYALQERAQATTTPYFTVDQQRAQIFGTTTAQTDPNAGTIELLLKEIALLKALLAQLTK